METKPVKVAAEFMWAHLRRPNEMSGAYQIELCNLSPRAVAALEELGVEARKNPDKPEKGYFITCKSKHPIKALDSHGEEIIESVGNGSKGFAVLGSYEWSFKNKKGVSPSLKKLVVTELVEYHTGTETNLDEEEAL